MSIVKNSIDINKKLLQLIRNSIKTFVNTISFWYNIAENEE